MCFEYFDVINYCGMPINLIKLVTLTSAEKVSRLKGKEGHTPAARFAKAAPFGSVLAFFLEKRLMIRMALSRIGKWKNIDPICNGFEYVPRVCIKWGNIGTCIYLPAVAFIEIAHCEWSKNWP